MSTTDRLISGLVDDLEPVRPLPRLRSAFAIVLAVWTTLLGVVLLSLEGDSSTRSLATDPVFGASFLGLLVAALGGTLSALAAGQPDRERTEKAGLFLAFAGLMGAAIACLLGIGSWEGLAEASPPGADAMCFEESLFLSLLPGGVLLAFLVRGWTARPVRAALVALAASGALGTTIVHLACDFLGPRHLLMGHLTVPIAMALLGLYPLSIWLKRLRG